MTTFFFDPFEEFQQYLAGISFQDLISNAEYSATSKRLHKRVLALLIVEHQFGIELKKSPSGLSDATIPFLEEFRSDILSSMLILHIGLYKAALMSARSAIENLFRVIAGTQKVDFRNLKTVFELVELVKNSPLYRTSEIFQSSSGLIIDKYADYCGYVHSSGDKYLSLERKLIDLPRWQKDVGNASTDSLIKVTQAAICILLIMKSSALSSLRHDQKDLVLDALSMNMKAKLTKEIST
jgi:hypothetical protein